MHPLKSFANLFICTLSYCLTPTNNVLFFCFLVFLPIVLITFLIGIIRHYVTVLLSSDKKVDMAKVRDSQILIRSRSLRENAKYLPKSSFLMRRHYFNNDER